MGHDVTTFDPADPVVMRNPYELFRQLRETEPVHFSEPLQGWVVTSHELATRVVDEPDPFSSDRLGGMGSRLPEPQRSTVADVLRWLGLWMVFRDPPDHTRIRSHLRKVVSPPAMKVQREAIEEITAMLLDRFPRDEAFDFYHDFGLKLPGFVTMDMLGVPRERLEEVKSWSDDMMLFIGSSRDVPDKYERARRGAQSMAGLFAELVAQRRAEPRDDVLSGLIASEEEDGSVLSEDELVASMMMIANGAQETTAHAMSNALIAMRDRPEVAERFRALDSGDVQRATEELLRYDGSVLSTARLVSTDIEFGGRELREGDRVFSILIAANRDPAVFTDPDDIDLGRRPNPHMTFSRGAHVCLGAPLARLEVQIALTRMLERFERIELAEPVEDIPWVNSMVARGPSRLPLRVG